MPEPLPHRPPAEVARVLDALREQGQCCPHPKGAHGPDDGCRMCAVDRTTTCSGWSPAWAYVASGAEAGQPAWASADHLGNAHLVGVEDSGALICLTPGCGHRADRHQEQPVQATGLGGCLEDGCDCWSWLYVTPDDAGDDVVDAEVGSSGDPLLDLVHDVLARHFPVDLDGRWVRARDELTDAVRAAAQVRWS